MTIFDLLTLIFGIALFLFGMSLMGETLKKSAGRKLKRILEKLTENPWKGFLLGTLVTAVIQSSSATTVMVVGFVNSGTMLLSQAVGVIMGANVGTAVTSWITALSGLENGGRVGTVMQWFKPSVFTPIIALIGLLLYMIGKNDRKKNLGLVLLGFSVLMIGMSTMSDAVEGLEENDAFRSILLAFENPILGLLAGLVLTAIVQSSSASIGILQTFTATGAITFGNAVPIIMGQNIGTCVTALLASIGTNKNAKRASVVHLLFNVFGSGFSLAIFYLLKYAFRLSFLEGKIDMWGIATVHTLFNFLTILILFPFTKQLVKLAVLLVREKGKEDRFSILEPRLLATPSVAIERSRMLTIKMAELSMEAIERACSMIVEGSSEKKAEAVQANEIAVDEYEDKLGTYLVQISEESILDRETHEINRLLHLLGDLERISDHAVHLADSAEELREKRITLPKECLEELSVLLQAIREIAQLTVAAVKNKGGEDAGMVEPLKQVIDTMRNELKHRQIQRLQTGIYSIEQSFVLADIFTNLERVVGHCSNVAGCMMEPIDRKRNGLIELHRDLRQYRTDSAQFEARKRMFEKKYGLGD